MGEKDDFIKRLTDNGMSLSDALNEWGIHLHEIEAYGEYDDPDYTAKKKSKKKKDTRVASLRSSKDKKFKGHTTYKT